MRLLAYDQNTKRDAPISALCPKSFQFRVV
jgi:hypothetical protein